jgi:hypothetical protein
VPDWLMAGFKRYSMDIAHYIRKLKNRNKSTYNKSICEICNQVCYNETDLEIHIRNKHSSHSSG